MSFHFTVVPRGRGINRFTAQFCAAMTSAVFSENHCGWAGVTLRIYAYHSQISIKHIWVCSRCLDELEARMGVCSTSRIRICKLCGSKFWIKEVCDAYSSTSMICDTLDRSLLCAGIDSASVVCLRGSLCYLTSYTKFAVVLFLCDSLSDTCRYPKPRALQALVGFCRLLRWPY